MARYPVPTVFPDSTTGRVPRPAVELPRRAPAPRTVVYGDGTSGTAPAGGLAPGTGLGVANLPTATGNGGIPATDDGCCD